MRSLVLSMMVCCLLVGCGRREVVDEIVAPKASVWDTLPPIEPCGDDWPWWRGPTFDNRAAGPQSPPVHWSETENVLWKAEVPGRGHGSPCIWGNRIYVTTADDHAEVQSLLCFDRATGEQLSMEEVHRGGFMHAHEKNSNASATPACDGQRVYVAFMLQDGIWITAFDLDGSRLWQEKAAPFRSRHGFAASPLLYKSLLIIPSDNRGPGYVTALHRETGQPVWRTYRSDDASFASPIIGHVCGRDQLFITGPKRVDSYDPNTGEWLWSCDGPAKVAASTAVFDEQRVYVSAGYPKKNLLCIRADGSGDVTETHIEWQVRNKATYVPSLLLDEGLLYMVNDRGLARCFEAESGQLVWKHQFNGAFSSSPVLAGGNIYVADEEGRTHVFRAGREFKLLSRNDLGDGGFATPAICGGRIYLRTLQHLYCLGIADGP